ncbi:aldo/keto reductase [Homoserinibacter sp. YIM 151385]|uniref:aldo/keto reductase n=1 Tax=Homoserinibacter sp. YIM 151385 TaxID=2985506 RepID=UPI0022EFE4CB|nr:aldo/keto reductase [Homoserinibacter sp. YIM 151385]WBU37759.1 aldo/keto reductase [Homoserinibacter sp. YIM 151385]
MTSTSFPTRALGSTGLTTGAVGLGAEMMSNEPLSRETSVATIRAALDAGMSLIDTGDFYGMGDNEELIREALRPGDRERTILSVKFNGLKDPAGRFVGIEGRPEHVKNFLTYSLRRLGTDHVDIYRPSRLAADVPIEDTVGAISELIDAGYVRHLGLSEVGSETIRRAHAVHPVADVQLEYSVFSRGIERDILGTCLELGIGITAYAVLGHGLLTGDFQRDAVDPRFKGHLPRFDAENLPANLALVDGLRVVAERRGVSVAQLAIAWELAKSERIVPLVGARRPERIAQALEAAHLVLSAEEVAEIERLVPASAIAGTRYAAPLMALLDSER